MRDQERLERLGNLRRSRSSPDRPVRGGHCQQREKSVQRHRNMKERWIWSCSQWEAITKLLSWREVGAAFWMFLSDSRAEDGSGGRQRPVRRSFSESNECPAGQGMGRHTMVQAVNYAAPGSHSRNWTLPHAGQKCQRSPDIWESSRAKLGLSSGSCGLPLDSSYYATAFPLPSLVHGLRWFFGPIPKPACTPFWCKSPLTNQSKVHFGNCVDLIPVLNSCES